MTRECPRCAEEKPHADYYQRKNGRLSTYCRECEKARNREWRQEKPEHARDTKRAYREANRDKARAWGLAWYHRNKDQALASKARWFEANREREMAKQRERATRWYYENLDYARERARERAPRWAKENPEKARDNARRSKIKRRYREKVAHIEPVSELVALELYDGVCPLCGEDVDPFDFHLDHIIPLARGGLHNQENVQPAHAFCNLSKGARLPEAA